MSDPVPAPPTPPRIVLGVCGGIAAYKACELCSRLRKDGAHVRVAMTAAATRFVSPLTFETLAHHPVYTSVLERPESWEMEHISWGSGGAKTGGLDGSRVVPVINGRGGGRLGQQRAAAKEDIAECGFVFHVRCDGGRLSYR